jgi:hypothetical protein
LVGPAKVRGPIVYSSNDSIMGAVSVGGQGGPQSLHFALLQRENASQQHDREESQDRAPVNSPVGIGHNPSDDKRG